MDESHWRIKIQPAATGSRKFQAWSQIVTLCCWLLFVVSSNIPAHKYTQTNDHVPLSHSRLTRLVATLEKQECTASAAVQICYRELHNQLLYVKWMLKCFPRTRSSTSRERNTILWAHLTLCRASDPRCAGASGQSAALSTGRGRERLTSSLSLKGCPQSHPSLHKQTKTAWFFNLALGMGFWLAW